MKKLFTLVAFMATALTMWAQGTELWSASTIESVETWSPSGDCTATLTDGKVTVHVGTTAGWQWGGQVKLHTNVVYNEAKQYDFAFKATTSTTVGGVTFKIDDNTGIVYEDQTLTIDAATGLNYSKKNVDGKPGNGIIVFDFGYAAPGTDIVLSDFSVVEHDPVAPEFPVVDPAATTSASTGNAALGCDGNVGTRWESQQSDNQWWCVNYGEQKEMDHIKITWEGAYGKTFEIYGSNNATDWDMIANVEDQTLNGFPYVQVIELDGVKKYQYVLFRGIKRGTPYGYSFWEFETYKAEAAVLTTLEFSAAPIAKVGAEVALTVATKDQYGVAMDAEVTYSVSPADAGHVVDGKYVADKKGAATITATAGELSKDVAIFNYAGENVALSTNLATDNKIVAQSNEGEFEVGSAFDAYFAVDDNEGSVWQGSLTNGGSDVEEDRTYDAWFVVDLGKSYDVELVTINFEGACSQDYHVDFSADNVAWTTAFNYVGTPGIQGRTDYLFPGGEKNLEHNTGVRYVRFYSTKAGTQWGVKLFSFKVFGTEATSTGINNVETVSASNAVYNLAGQRVNGAQKGIIIVNGKKVIK